MKLLVSYQAFLSKFRFPQQRCWGRIETPSGCTIKKCNAGFPQQRCWGRIETFPLSISGLGVSGFPQQRCWGRIETRGESFCFPVAASVSPSSDAGGGLKRVGLFSNQRYLYVSPSSDAGGGLKQQHCHSLGCVRLFPPAAMLGAD